MGPSRYGHPEVVTPLSDIEKPARNFWSFNTLNIDGPLANHYILNYIKSVSTLKVAFEANFMVKPNEQLVTVSSTHYCAYTPVLSNW